MYIPPSEGYWLLLLIIIKIDADLAGADLAAVQKVAKATMLIGDPSYFPSRMVKPTGMVARSICIMDHPFNGTNNAESTQIIIPGRQARCSPCYVNPVSIVTTLPLYKIITSLKSSV